MKTYSLNQVISKLLITVAIVVITNAASAQNLVVNPGFTNGTQGWNTNCTIEINPEHVYGGSGSNPVIEIDIERCFHQEIAVQPGTIYDLGYKASRRQGGTPATVGVRIIVTGVQSGTEYVNTTRTYTNTSWNYTNEQFTFTIPANTTDTRVSIAFSNYITTGTYGTLLDDITMAVNAQSAILSIKTKTPVAVVRNNNSVEPVLYPNPATSSINYLLNSNNKKSANLQIYNVSGTLVMNKRIQLNKGANIVTLDINSLQRGSFYLKVADNDGLNLVKPFSKS